MNRRGFRARCRALRETARQGEVRGPSPRTRSVLLWPKAVLLSVSENGGRRSAPRSHETLFGFQIDRGNAATLALLKVVTQGLAFLQAVHAGPLNRGDVDEHIRPAAGRLDKPETLLRIEPFDFAGRHTCSSNRRHSNRPPKRDASDTEGDRRTETPPAGKAEARRQPAEPTRADMG